MRVEPDSETYSPSAEFFAWRTHVNPDTRRAGARGDIIIAAVAFAALVAIGAISIFPRSLIAEWISRSHVSAHVPSDERFDALLTRDLDNYFTTTMRKDVSVAYELLRMRPTQTGVSFPKFYAWVVIRSRQTGAEISQGAVRVAAREATSFFVTDYISLADMKADPGKLKEVFPGPVVDRIRMRF